MRSKKAIYTAVSAIVLQIILIVVNLILPRFIIQNYGSETNGLINSITNFLGYIVLLEGGIGGVLKAAFYRTLARKDKKELSVIIVSVRSFFRKICIGLIVYIVALCSIYPMFVAKEFDTFFTISLIIIVAISSFAQYFFGLVNQILLQADQRGYVVHLTKIFTYVISTIVMLLMVSCYVDIRLVKLAGTLILSVPPIIYYLFVKKYYDIDYSVKKDNNILKQRWDGFAHQVSAFVHSNTDIVLLTIFSSMSEVSVYSVYALVTGGLKSILSTFTNSISAAFGSLHAGGEARKFSRHFAIFDYFNCLITIFCFAIAGVFIAPFVQIYVNASDVNYFQPLFGLLLVIAEMIYCFRCSYSNIIFVVGDFKSTKKHGYIEASINIILSLCLIKPLGIIGIAIGTVCGMLYRWIVSISYVHRNIMHLDIFNIIKKYAINLFFAAITMILFANCIHIDSISSLQEWITKVFFFSAILASSILLANLLFFKKDFLEMYNEYIGKIFNKFRKGKNERNNK